MKPRRARAQISKHLGLRDVAKMLGWVAEATGEPTRYDLRRVRRRLRRAEQELGRRLLYGGGRPGGRGGGGRCWTTYQALRTANLLDDTQILDEIAREYLRGLREDIDEHADLIDLLDQRQRVTAKALRRTQQQVGEIVREVTG